MKNTVLLVGSGVVPIPPRKGGATELIIYEISRHMPKDKMDVYVLDRKEDYNKSTEVVGGAWYFRQHVPKFRNIVLMRAAELAFGIMAIPKIASIAKKKPVIVHAHTVFTALPIALLRFMLPNTKIVYTCHNPAWTAEDVGFANRIIKGIEAFAMRRSDLVTTVSDEMKENISKAARIQKDKIKRVYNFVDTSIFSPKYGKKWKSSKSIKGPVVFFVSKLTPNKGVEYLLKAAQIVKKAHPEVTFVVAGPASFEFETANVWEKLAKDLGLGNVIFTGGLGMDELPQAYSASDIFCFPTLRESFGMVVIEAMASGLPVITTDLDVLREIAGNSAIFVKERDPEALANQIKRLIEKKELWNQMAKRSLQRSKMFDVRKIMREYERIYETIE